MNPSILVLIITVIKRIKGEQCPPNYVLCAQKGAYCNVPSQITSGYISFGNLDQFTLTPFVKKVGIYSILCNSNTNGQSQLGHPNSDFYTNVDPSYCCIAEDAVGFSTDLFFTNYLYPGSPFNIIIFDHYEQYSPNDRWNFYVDMGDGWGPLYGSSSVTGLSMDAHSSLLTVENNLNWIYCGNYPNKCEGLIPGQPTWIKMTWPNSGASRSRLVIANSDGTVDCQHYLNDDYFSGTSISTSFPTTGTKECYRAEGETHTFTKNTGYWHRAIHCSGCSSSQYRLSTGITSTTTDQVTKGFTDTFETSLANGGGFEFSKEIETGNVKSTTTVSINTETTISAGFVKSIARSLSQTISVKREETKVINCDKDGLYQWIFTTLDRQIVNGIGGVLYTIYGSEYECIDGNIPPQCIPGDCADANCQTCLNFP